MAQYHQPKNLSVVPPILRRKFIVPDNPRELGSLVAIIGVAISLTCAWPSAHDLFSLFGKQQAQAKLVASVPYRASLETRLVGVYLFKDETNALVAVRGNRVYLKKAAIANKVTIVWKSSRSTQAKGVFEYLDYLLGLPIGLGIFGWGLTLLTKKPDPFEEAMASGLENESASR
jgi:hypothetical protein